MSHYGSKTCSFWIKRCIKKVFWTYVCFSYPNDLAIVAKTDSQHEDTLLKVMVAIRIKTLLWTQNNVILVNQKSNFGVCYLLLNRVTPDPEKMKVLENIKSPKDKDESNLSSARCKIIWCKMYAWWTHDILYNKLHISSGSITKITEWDTLLLDTHAPKNIWWTFKGV